MKREKILANPNGKATYEKNLWDKGDFAFLNGYTKIQILQQDTGLAVLSVRYIETNLNHKAGEIVQISRRQIYPRRRKLPANKSRWICQYCGCISISSIQVQNEGICPKCKKPFALQRFNDKK